MIGTNRLLSAANALRDFRDRWRGRCPRWGATLFDLTSALLQVRELRVINRSSANAFKARTIDTRAAAKSLGVDHVIEVTVRPAGGTVRVNAELVNAADGVSQGNAGLDEFRSAPLWGLGQRIFFLHDGRTTDLLDAIRQHASFGSEANGVIVQFRALTESQKQDLFNFLRSL